VTDRDLITEGRAKLAAATDGTSILDVRDRALWIDHQDGNADALTGPLPVWGDEWADLIMWAVNNLPALLDQFTEADQLIADIADLVPGEKSARGNVLGAVGDLVAERDRLRESGKFLGEVIRHYNDIALDATGLHHLIDEDRDGDWQAVWENVADLGQIRAAYEKLQADTQEAFVRIAAKQQRDAARIAELEAAQRMSGTA
jgi:hypothetical protein